MTKVEVPLKHGLKAGKDVVHHLVKLRELNAGDIIGAREDAEKLLMTPDGPALVVSPTMLGTHLLCRQIFSIGSIKGPISLQELGQLHPEDLNDLQAKADEMDEAMFAAAASSEVEQRGRDDGLSTSD